MIGGHGSVYGDKKTFYLVLDIKEANPDLPPALRKLLASYSDILTEYTDASVNEKAVTIPSYQVKAGDIVTLRVYNVPAKNRRIERLRIGASE